MASFLVTKLAYVFGRNSKPPASPIVFYDGECGLCNRSVQWLLRRDSLGVFLFAPLQGTTARRLLDERDRTDLTSMVLLDNNGIHRRSTAVLRSIAHLRGLYRVCLLALIIPPSIRDTGYNIVARNRHRIKPGTMLCQVPDVNTRQRLLS
jgi:predicted DCC family thiol-disulfide oxidoreductase YuxK